MKEKCWKCKTMNEVQEDGYCFCPRCNLWYAPKKQKKPEQTFLDDEEKEK